MLARPTNPRGILMQIFSVVNGMKWQTYRKRLVIWAYGGICFLKDEKTMRVYGAVGDRKSTYMDISYFPTRYYNPCQKDRWKVFCIVYDITSSKSSLWVNHGKICDFAYRLPLKPSTLNCV